MYKRQGIYCSLLEVIAQNVKSDNIDEWGCVDARHDLGTLADECACTIEELKDFLVFCNEKQILYKKDGKLYCPLILERLDEYASKIKQKSRSKQVGRKSRQHHDDIPTLSEQHRDKIVSVSGIEEEGEEEKEEKKILTASISYLQNIPQTDVTEFVHRFELTEKQLTSKAEDLVNYCKQHGVRYKNYKAFLFNAVKKDFKTRSQKSTFQPPQIVNPMTKEQSQELLSKARQTVGRAV